jgi:hypothetical protein
LNSNNQPEQDRQMTAVENKEHATELTTEEWLAIRKEAGLRIEFANTPLGAAAVAKVDGTTTLAGIGA